jgi:hypothetical protein
MPQKQIDAALLAGSFVSPSCSLPIISNNKQESNPIAAVELNDHASRGQLSRIHDIGSGCPGSDGAKNQFIRTFSRSVGVGPAFP